MASGQGVVEHYVVRVRVRLAAMCATANPGFTPPILETPCLIYFFKILLYYWVRVQKRGIRTGLKIYIWRFDTKVPIAKLRSGNRAGGVSGPSIPHYTLRYGVMQ